MLDNLVAQLEPFASKPSLGQAALKRVYLEYQFLQSKGTSMDNSHELLRTWVIESFVQMEKGQEPKPPPARLETDLRYEVEQVIQKCYSELKQHIDILFCVMIMSKIAGIDKTHNKNTSISP
ncbi:MAG: hypothetical protein ACK41E_06765 [Deinococcales bacterium]